MQNNAPAEVIDIESVSIPDLYVSPGKIADQLKRSGPLVLTDNENLVAVMLDVDGANLQETLLGLRRLRAQRIIRAMQEASVKNGTSNMTLQEINAEIAAARAERKNG